MDIHAASSLPPRARRVMSLLAAGVFLLSACKMPSTPLPSTTGAIPSVGPTATLSTAPALPTAVLETTAARPELESTPGTPIPARAVLNPENVSRLADVNVSITEEEARDFSWIGDSQSLVISSGEELSFYDLPSTGETQAISTTVTLMAVAPQGSQIAWATEADQVQVWDAEEAKIVQTFESSAGAVTGLAFSPQGKNLAFATSDQKLSLVETDRGDILKTLNLPYWLSALSFSPDGKQIAGVEFPAFTVHFFDAASGQELRSLAWTESASPVLTGAFFSPDWKQIAWVARGTVQLMDAETGALGASLEHEDAVSSLAWSPNSQLLATAAAGTLEGNFMPLVNLWEAAGGELVKTLPQAEVVLEVSFAPDGRLLGTLDSAGQIQLWAAP